MPLPLRALARRVTLPAAVGALLLPILLTVVRTAPATALSVTRVGSASSHRYSGHGIDECYLPSARVLAGPWSTNRVPFGALNIYVGGVNEGCPQPLTAAWVRTVTRHGWDLIPTYVGLQAPRPRCGCAGISPRIAWLQGQGAARAAVRDLKAIGIGRGNIIYYDMEGYTRGLVNSLPVLRFLSGWTATLHRNGYYSGVYSSGSSGIADLARFYGSRYPEPDDIWIADWNGWQSVRDPYVPDGDWAHHHRLHQYAGGVSLTAGGVTLNFDADVVDGAVVTAGSL